MLPEVEEINSDLNNNYQERIYLEKRLKKIQDNCKHEMEFVGFYTPNSFHVEAYEEHECIHCGIVERKVGDPQ